MVTAHVWESVEITLKSNKKYGNPFRDVEVRAEFIGPSAERLIISGFWNGKNEWKIRFAPISVGKWIWRSVCSEPFDTGLHNKYGEIFVSPWAETQLKANPLRRGFIKVHESGRYFVYGDGTPFYWLGDTLWSAHTKRFDVQYSLPKYIKDRKAKGFTVIQMVIGHPAGGEKDEDSGAYNRGTPDIYINEGGAPYKRRYDLINPEYFRHFDRRLEGFLEAGMLPCLVGQWCWDLKGMGLENLKEYWRYIIARYASYNVIWSITGEYNFYPKAQEFRELGWHVHHCDPYQHPTTAHANAPHSGSIHYQADEWYDFNFIQVGHVLGFRQLIEQLPFIDYHTKPVKPTIMSESWYENHPNCVLEKGRITAKDIRFAAYVSILQGCIGQTYGAHGIWTWYEGNCSEQWSPFDKPSHWKDELTAEGSCQMKHLRTVMESVRWWLLEPHPEWVTSPQGTHCYCAAIYGQEYIAYVTGGECQLMVFVPAQRNDEYEGRWFNPRNGEWVMPKDMQCHGYGNWYMWRATTPDNKDWVLVLKKK